MAREQAVVFGEDAELYDAVRPGYSDAVVDEVLGHARLADGLGAVEVGPGTGKATVAFASRGLPVVGVEPDPRMAEVLRRRTAGLPGVEIEVGRFEDWSPAGRRFGLLYAAQSWHWVDPELRWQLARQAVVPGGAVALLWNLEGLTDTALHTALAELDERYGVPRSNSGFRADELTPGQPDEADWIHEGLTLTPGFTDVRAVRVPGGVRGTSAEEWIRLRTSHSAVRMLGEPERAAYLDEMRQVVDAAGGVVELLRVTDVRLARTTG